MKMAVSVEGQIGCTLLFELNHLVETLEILNLSIIDNVT